MIDSPPTSACVRPIRSITVPTTSTSAYIPSTCAPMIGKTSFCSCPCSVDDDVAGQVHDADHDAEARERRESAGSDARAPDDLRERRGSGGAGGSARASSSAIRFGSGPDGEHEREPDDRGSRLPASQGTTSESASTSFPAKSGANTAGPRIAPNTEPKRTNEIPRARRSGGYMSPAGRPGQDAMP